MEQGRFRILFDDAGNATATNGFDNVGLLQGVERTAPSMKTNLNPATSARMANHRRGPVTLEDLKDMIQSAMGASN
jgi:hypothetical protein